MTKQGLVCAMGVMAAVAVAGEAETTVAPVATNTPEALVTVDGQSLSAEEARQRMLQVLSRQQVPPEQREQILAAYGEPLRKQVVNQFIDQTLLKAEAARRGLVASGETVDKGVARLAETLPDGMSLEDALKELGMTVEKLRADVAENEALRMLYEAETAGAPKVRDDDVALFYRENTDKFVTKEEVAARHILIACEAGAGADEQKAASDKAESVRAALLKGADFAEQARANSACPSKERGGDLGRFGRGQMVPEFDAAAFSQEVNAIGPVVKTKFGYHVVQVTEHDIAGTQALETVSADIRRYLEQSKREERFKAFLASLRAKAAITPESFRQSAE